MAKSTYSGESKQPNTQSSINLSQIKKDNAVRLVQERTYQKTLEKEARAQKTRELKDQIASIRKEIEALSSAESELRSQKYLEEKDLLKKLSAQEALLEYEASKKAQENAEKLYNQASIFDRQRLLKDQLAKDKAHKAQLDNEYEEHQTKIKNLEEYLALLEAKKEKTKDDQEEIDKANEVLTDLHNKSSQLDSNINNATAALKDIEKIVVGAQMSYLDGKAKEELVKAKISDYETHVADQRQKLLENELKKQEEIEKAKSSGKSPEEIKKEIDDITQHYSDEMSEINSDIAKALEDAATYISIAGENVRAAAEAQNNEAFLNTINEITKKKTDNAAKKELLQGNLKKSKKDIASQADRHRAANRELRAEERESKKLDEAEKAKQANEDFGPLLKENLKQSISAGAAMKAGFKMLDDLAKSIDESIDSFYQYQAQINARLQGSNEDFKKISKTIKDNVGFSGIVSQKEVVNNIKQLTDSGVAYNLELRAFLATTKDKIAETFDVFNGNLLRIIRIQQADTTAARLGMEASLTQLFNKYFSDTSYLGDISSGVSEALLEASAQMSRDNSIAFEYIVQKWLGALYSIGLSQDTVNTIAEGINYLSTGNVEALNNNDSMRTLFAMSASEAGMDFGELLLEGLNPEKTNLLLKSMVEYLGEIATNISENKVTQSVYADLFGTSRIDLQVFANLKNDVESISQSTLAYEQALAETNYQLTQVASRMHLSQMLDTVLENVKVDVANNIGGNFLTYGLWKAVNIIDAVAEGIPIPTFGVMGNSVDLETSVMGIVKAVMAGGSLLTSLISGISSGNLFGSLNLDAWGFDEYTARGKNITAINTGFASGTSESSSLIGVGNSNADDIKTTSLTDATDQAKEDSKITNKDVQENIDVYTQIRDALYKDENTTALTELQSIRKRLDDPFITSGSGGGTSTGTSTGTPTGTSTGNATNITAGENELLPITESLTDILTSIQGIRGRLDIPFTISNPSVIVQDSTSSEGFTVIKQESSSVNQELLTQIRDTVTDGGTSTLLKELQGIRGRLDEPFGTQLVTTQNSISDLIEQTHINSSTIKDMLTSDSFKLLINTSNSSNNEINTNNTIDQTIDAMGVLLSLLSLNRVFKVEFDDSKGTINNQTSSSTSSESINSNINSTTYVEAIANHTNVISQLTTAVHDLNSSIVSTISEEFKNTQLVDNISSLQSQVSAISSTLGISNIQGTNAKNDVYLNGMADDVKSSLATSIAAALTNILTKSVEQGHSISVTDIQNMLSLMNLNVTVTNDYFSDVLRKEAFNN